MENNNYLICKLIKVGLEKESTRVLDALKSGFNVCIKSNYLDILEIFKTEMKNLVKNKNFYVEIFDNYDDFYQINNKELKCLIISDHDFFPGSGCVLFELNNIDYLIGSVTKTIEIILETNKMSYYVDAFDAEIVSYLKKIIKKYGISKLIDCVIQCAYLAGFCGCKNDAISFLKKFDELGGYGSKENNTLESSASLYLNYIIQQQDKAYDFLKSSFTYYAIAKQGLNISKASVQLGISRTTLHEYLKIAQSLGVNRLFEKNISDS